MPTPMREANSRQNVFARPRGHHRPQRDAARDQKAPAPTVRQPAQRNAGDGVENDEGQAGQIAVFRIGQIQVVPDRLDH
jgi:hypothetical protein